MHALAEYNMVLMVLTSVNRKKDPSIGFLFGLEKILVTSQVSEA